MFAADRTIKKLLIRLFKKSVAFLGYFFDHFYLDPTVPISKIAGHSNYMQYLTDIGNHKGIKILEIGSREVTGVSDARNRFLNAEYVGFDYYPGPNVDVVGDAHKLSQYFEEESFDIIYSSAVLEHLAMPWIAATEIAKILKVGGILFIETHFSFKSHERPWHFFQFSDMALKVLFSPALGIECIEAGVSNPIVGRFSSYADGYLKYRPVSGLYCHTEFLGRKVRKIDMFSWADVALSEVVGGTKYPVHQEVSQTAISPFEANNDNM
ncbi:methyltransferase domain-containing protein [Pelotalea chapellei]|uniref:Methyltransferase domain-containing protein n=1 Tax=Pelotalea chapellei TaxID=44671 RepID=A0ABS5U5M0_9BACT|nr:class I SAM-dependent methyltransferase [Pelotalea chapellei]MBT1070965.1 methyltransferase domain-containing protein [Pelotalea chapellei]